VSADVVTWLAHSMRYHSYCVVALVAAVSMVHLIPASMLCLALTVSAAALFSQWPELAKVVFGVTPWLQFGLLEGATFLAAAIGVHTVVDFIIVHALLGCIRFTMVQPLQRLVTYTSTMYHQQTFAAVCTAVVVASTACHPSLPVMLGVVMLLCRCAVFTYGGMHRQWLGVHVCCSFPAASWLVGWALSGTTVRYGWDIDRGLLAVQGGHAAVIALMGSGRGIGQFWGKSGSVCRKIASLVVMGAAAVTGVYGCWGYPYVTLYTAAAVQGVHLVCGYLAGVSLDSRRAKQS
jgi:hypothetical protein